MDNGMNQTPLQAGYASLKHEHKNLGIYDTLRKVCFLGCLIHIVFIFFFLSIGAISLSVVNVVSVVIWLFAFYFNQRGRYKTCISIITIEALFHATFSVHFLGLSLGFQYYLWPVAALILVAREIPIKQCIVISLLCITLFACLEIGYVDKIYTYAYPVITDYAKFINIIAACLPLIIAITNIRLDRSETEKVIYEIANKDELTNTFNRRFIYDIMENKQGNRRQNELVHYALILCDIDHFKKVNDLMGHHVGDDVIKQTAKQLIKCTRASDMVARWGGEQFLIVLKNTDSNNATFIVEKIRKSLHTDVKIKGLQNHKITLSFGIAVARPGEKFEDALRRADVRMYKAKKLGRDRMIYDH